MHVKHAVCTSLAALAVLASILPRVAQAQVIVIAHPTAEAPSKDLLADVYLGKSQAFAPLDQSEGSPIHADFYKKATGRDLAQVKSTWSRLVFTGKAQAPRQLPDSQAVKKAVAADPRALGYIDKSALDGTVKAVLTLD